MTCRLTWQRCNGMTQSEKDNIKMETEQTQFGKKRVFKTGIFEHPHTLRDTNWTFEVVKLGDGYSVCLAHHVVEEFDTFREAQVYASELAECPWRFRGIK